MRISLVTQFFPPETFAGANRVKTIADALAPIGSLVVAAPWPSYPDSAIYRDFREQSVRDGVTVRRIAPFTAQQRGWAVRAAGESLMAGRLAFAAGRGGSDVFVASSPSMFLGPATLAAARAQSARFVWDLRDLTWEYGKEDGVVTGRGARAALAAVGRLMWRTARASDVVICATEGLASVVSDRVPSQRVELIQNGVDRALLERFDPSPPPANERTRVLYAGLVGHAQALEVLLDVAQLAAHLEIIVAGDGPQRTDLMSDARKRGLTNLTFTGYVGVDQLLELYHTSDLLFAQLRSSDLHSRTAAPSKLFEYMAAGRPIVYAGAGLAAELVLRSGGGRVVPAGDAAAIADVIGSMDEADRLLLGRSARQFVEGLPTRADEMHRLAVIVQELA
jgi:colanic acid biosynthesis glycosyl transferase WcaI